MGNKNTGKKYTQDFKKMIVELYRSGSSVKELSNEYGVSEVTIYNWNKKYSPIKTEDGLSLTADDISKMQKQMLRLQEENEILKKGYGHIREKVNSDELMGFIQEKTTEHPVSLMCEVLNIPRSTYYQSLNKVESKREKENRQITERMTTIHKESKGRYGAPKIHHQLTEEGIHISLKRVQRLMKKADIHSIVKKKFRPYSSNEKVVNRENILKRDFSTASINEKWVADITYVHTVKDGWCYLASVMDLHSRKIVGYSFSEEMTTDVVIKALENAYVTQLPPEGLILHTDLGSQYTSQAFTDRIKSYGITHSFSQKGCPYDNACIESFHAILKKEEVNHVQYLDYKTANIAIFEFIEAWYNRKRKHSSIAYKTPQAIEELFKDSA
ncbi:IS3 family transposase [Bacillus sp. SCS-151]|uniref:IS3 family transposase n=3 Tax=Bacillaceae TaxID=186817 RepID=UPI00397861C3